MPLTIGSNISSLTAQRRLSEGTSQLSKTYERLSSGQRINSASDDAAGLSISESLRSDRRVFAQGIRNFNDGLSLLTIADGAIESLSGIIIRLKELAEQSANGAYSSAQRSALDREAQSLSKEYSRLIFSTKFNGKGLLDGSVGDGLRLQGGFGSDGSIFSSIGGAIGTGTFNSSSTYASALAADVITGDFNGDGFLDIASVGGANTGELLLGNGDGTFRTAMTFDTGNNPFALTATDLNGDGILDLAVADFASNAVSILIGNGNGTFKSRVSYASGNGTNAVRTGDFNGDGIIDLAAANSSSSNLTVYIGTGNGTFSSAVTYATGGNSMDLTIGDFNGDQILDIASVEYSAGASIFLGTGNGTFKAGTDLISTAGDILHILSADFNGDDNLDIVVSGGSAANAEIFFGTGSGTFSAGTNLPAIAASDLLAADVNGDGLMDLIGVNTTLDVYLGNGNGTFANRITFTATATTTAIASGDFNEDGVIDITTAGGYSRVFLNNTEDGVGPLLPFSLQNRYDSLQALTQFTKALDRLSAQRGIIGSFQSRVGVGSNVLAATAENYASAESRIRDADIADDSSQLLRLNILQQAASAVLAQANLQPQLAITLLSN